MTPKPGRARSITTCSTIVCVTIAAGLASRRYPQAFPAFIARYAGDTLWAVMAFWIIALFARRASTIHIAIASLAIAYAVELSQLYHAAWIDTLRSTRIGELTLGSGFLWSDLVCYAVGVSLAASIDAAINGQKK